MKKINNEVYYNESPTLTLNQSDIESLIKKALENDRERVRICTHLSPEDTTQEMIIVHSKKAYVRAHKHLIKPESFHIIFGQVDVFVFNENGAILRKIEMGDFNSGKPFYYRIEKNVIHSMLIKSDVLVFQETTTGPFNMEETEFPSWAPEETNEIDINIFLNKLQNFPEVKNVN